MPIRSPGGPERPTGPGGDPGLAAGSEGRPGSAAGSEGRPDSAAATPSAPAPRRRRGETRARMVRTAADLLSTDGVAGTSIDRVLAVSGAPRGSVYHHFPDGRRQILAEAVDLAGETISRNLREAPHAAGALDAFVAYWRRRLASTDFRAGCPLMAVVADTDADVADSGLGERAGEHLARWETELASRLGETGLSMAAAEVLAGQSLSVLEGAVLVSRARRSMEPLDAAAEAIHVLHRQAARA